MHVTLIVTSNNRRVRLNGGRKSAMQQSFLAPKLRTGPTTKRYDLTIGGRYINRGFIETQWSETRRIVRPPGLSGIQRKHGDAALKTDGVDVRS